MSKQFKELHIKIVDNDGEFLLIEAAGTLPAWLEPDVADNRVWINQGGLVIIKPEDEGKYRKKAISEQLDLRIARQLLLTGPKRLMRSASIEEEAFYRLRNYPHQIAENIHHAIVTVPRKVAYLLHQKPSYISPAVEAFYLRDPISLKPLQNQLTFGPDDLVTISIAIPRVGYAQLKSQDFPPPKAWEKSLPAKGDSKRYNPIETGMKISCGLEMLVADPQSQDKPAVREMKMLLDDLDTGDEQLPSDTVISAWEQREDDEKWLNISFEDLEKELGGRTGFNDAGSFGDKGAQENLQRIVAQFEKFLNDEAAGPEGAGLFDESTDDELNSDDDISDDDDDDEEEEEDKDVSFSDDQLAKMMREMMGMPSSSTPRMTIPSSPSKNSAGRFQELGSNEEEDPTVEDIESFSRQIEAELNESGALDLNRTQKKCGKQAPKHITSGGEKGKGKATGPPDLISSDEDGDFDDAEVNDIDINLARNLLESFKSQAGLAGPSGNMMGLMGMGIPRDEGHDD